MNQLLSIVFSFHFFLSGILLPQGNFSLLSYLSTMYHHCKATEDPDLAIPDFIEEHWLNLEDKFDLEREQKKENELPHRNDPLPIPVHSIASIFVAGIDKLLVSFEIAPPVIQHSSHFCCSYHFIYTAFLLKPPVS